MLLRRFELAGGGVKNHRPLGIILPSRDLHGELELMVLHSRLGYFHNIDDQDVAGRSLLSHGENSQKLMGFARRGGFFPDIAASSGRKILENIYRVIDEIDVTMEYHLSVPRSGGVTSMDRTEIVQSTIMVID